jgi:MFS family permease
MTVGAILSYFFASKNQCKKVWLKFDKRLLRFYVTCFFAFGIWAMQNNHRLPLFKEAGLSISMLGVLALISLWVDAGTESISGWLGIDKLKNARLTWTFGVLGLVLASFGLIFLANHYLSFFLYAILFGICGLMPTLSTPSVNYVAEHYKEEWGPIYGTTLCLNNLSMALFTWLGGLFYGWFGSYQLILILTTIALFISAFTLKKE